MNKLCMEHNLKMIVEWTMDSKRNTGSFLPGDIFSMARVMHLFIFTSVVNDTNCTSVVGKIPVWKDEHIIGRIMSAVPISWIS